MNYLQKYNGLAKYKPTYIESEEDVAKAADFLYELRLLEEAVAEEEKKEMEEVDKLIEKIQAKYSKVYDLIDKTTGEVRGKINHYVQNEIDNKHIINKKVSGNKATLTYVDYKKIMVNDNKLLLKGIVEGKYPDSFIEVKIGEMQKYIKATKIVPDGVEAHDSAYFIIKEKK